MKKFLRIKKNEEFQVILKNGKYFANRQFVVYYIVEKEKIDINHFLCGISVGKKLGHAVLRNHIKRRIRACLNNYKKQIPANIRMIIMARKGCINISHEQFEKGIYHLLVNAEIIRRIGS